MKTDNEKAKIIEQLKIEDFGDYIDGEHFYNLIEYIKARVRIREEILKRGPPACQDKPGSVQGSSRYRNVR